MADPRGPWESEGPAFDDAGIDASSAVDVVGRATEIARIVRWFDGDGPAMLLLAGPPGLGKTTVWHAVTDELRARGVNVLASAPSEAESRLSYSGLVDLLASELEAVRASLPPPQARALAVAMRLEDPGDRPADETAVTRGALEAFRAVAARHGRTLLAVDDLSWLDGPSLAILVYMARRLDPGDDVRILATHRTGVPEPSGLDRAGAVERRHLGAISVGGIHRIVRTHAGISLPRPRLLEIHAVTLGNPLHAIELARASAVGGVRHDGTLASLFEARIAALPEPARVALVLVALSADRSSRQLSTAWAASFDGPFLDAIDPAVADGLVSLADDRVRPAHPLVTHVAAEAAAPALRRSIHRVLAGSATDDEDRAVHLGRSFEGSDGPAAERIEAAARTTRARGARALSAELFESAARITPSDETEARGRRMLAAASAWFDAGDTHRVEGILEPMIERWPEGPQRAEARWRLGIALDEAGRWPEAMVIWREALDDTADGALTSQVRCSLAITAMYTDAMSAAIEWAGTAVEDAERAGDPAALARSLAVDAFVLAMSGRADGDALMERALAIEASAEENLGEWAPSALAAEVARHTGDTREAERHYEAVLDRAAARGDANVEQWAAFGLASVEILAGGIERASALADLVLDISEQTDVMRIPARSLRAHVDAWLGRIDDARATLAESMAMSRAADETTHLYGAYVVLGSIETCAGDSSAAASAFLEARTMAVRLGLRHATVLRSALLEAEAAATAGLVDQATEALAAFDEMAGAPPPRWSRPLQRRARAAMRLAGGEASMAIADLEAAIEDEIALPPDVGRALLALTVVERRLRRYRQARDTAGRARACFLDLGMPPFVAMADAELARIPGRRTTDGDPLTASERRIAELVAAGKTNKAVAAELVLSVKTVEVTLTRVYGKLGVSSRSELAARFRGLPRA